MVALSLTMQFPEELKHPVWNDTSHSFLGKYDFSGDKALHVHLNSGSSDGATTVEWIDGLVGQMLFPYSYQYIPQYNQAQNRSDIGYLVITRDVFTNAGGYAARGGRDAVANARGHNIQVWIYNGQDVIAQNYFKGKALPVSTVGSWDVTGDPPDDAEIEAWVSERLSEQS